MEKAAFDRNLINLRFEGDYVIIPVMCQDTPENSIYFKFPFSLTNNTTLGWLALLI